MLKIEHGRLVWFGSAASHARKPVPEFTTIIPPLPEVNLDLSHNIYPNQEENYIENR